MNLCWVREKTNSLYFNGLNLLRITLTYSIICYCRRFGRENGANALWWWDMENMRFLDKCMTVLCPTVYSLSHLNICTHTWRSIQILYVNCMPDIKYDYYYCCCCDCLRSQILFFWATKEISVGVSFYLLVGSIYCTQNDVALENCRRLFINIYECFCYISRHSIFTMNGKVRHFTFIFFETWDRKKRIQTHTK